MWRGGCRSRGGRDGMGRAGVPSRHRTAQRGGALCRGRRRAPGRRISAVRGGRLLRIAVLRDGARGAGVGRRRPRRPLRCRGGAGVLRSRRGGIAGVLRAADRRSGESDLMPGGSRVRGAAGVRLGLTGRHRVSDLLAGIAAAHRAPVGQSRCGRGRGGCRARTRTRSGRPFRHMDLRVGGVLRRSRRGTPRCGLSDLWSGAPHTGNPVDEFSCGGRFPRVRLGRGDRGERRSRGGLGR